MIPTEAHQQACAKAMNDPTYVVSVPCGDCHLCCTGNEQIIVFAEDDPAQFKTEINELGFMVLPHKPNGDCIYLEDGKCRIHGRQPYICRAFDCRHVYNSFMTAPRHERRREFKAHPDRKRLFDQGKAMQKKHPIGE